MAQPVADDRVSPFLMFLVKAMGLCALLAIVILVAYFMATMSKPQEQSMPNLVGMPIAQARQAATKVNARLIEHEEFDDRSEPGVVTKVDPDLAGRPVRPGRSINVWVSRGSRKVWVPDLRNKPKDDAASALTKAGLRLGSVNREYNNKIPFDYVVKQNPSSGKRLDRDTEVNLIISDGPNLDENGGNGESTANPDANPDQSAADTETRSFPLEVTVKRDGQGTRRVLVQYDDATGTHTPFDEMHGEGDVLSQTVDVTGPTMTVRVYYGDPPVLRNEQTFHLGRRRNR